MHEVSLKRTIDAPVAEVWAAWDDYAHIDRFNPNLSRSFLINDSDATGLGAERQCDLSDGKNFVQERVIEYVPEKRIVLDIFNSSVPLKRARAMVEMRALRVNQTELTFTLQFTPKMGLLGRIMVPLMKAQFSKALGRLVDGNKAYVERGTTVAHAA